jgi:hypothetical protein
MLFNDQVGATRTLSMRVSVATLVRVLLPHPENGERMLALERKAIGKPGRSENAVDVTVQPFGGAVRLVNPQAVHERTGDFQFDSARSMIERDFRIFIEPARWPNLRDFVLDQFIQGDEGVLDASPERELAEEFFDALKVQLAGEDYTWRAAGSVLEDQPAATDNPRAAGQATVRIYRVFEAHLTKPGLCEALLGNSAGVSKRDLVAQALMDMHSGGWGRANGVLVLPLKAVRDFYEAMPLAARGQSAWYGEHRLEATVAAVVDGVAVPQYQKVTERL